MEPAGRLSKHLLKKVGLTLLFSSSLALLLHPVTANAQTGTFTATTGPMATARYIHTATLLPNGKVLVAGGSGNSGYLASAELYDPALGTFTATTGPMTTARYGHTATLLPNGKVLVAGGDASRALASAELYDPELGTFTATTGPMTAARGYHTATLLPNGQVLVAGGSGNNGALASAELYDPASGTFTATAGPMTAARQSHTATLLPDGKVLVAGGLGNTGALASAELYDPALKTFPATTGPMTTARCVHTATLLPNGQVLVAGGSGNSGYLASAELYDPALGTFTATTGPMTAARGYHTATLLPNGQVLVAGGYDNNRALANPELYDPALGTFTDTTGPMTAARHLHTATLLPNGQVLVAGGYGNTGDLASAEMYDSIFSSSIGDVAVDVGNSTIKKLHAADGTVLWSASVTNDGAIAVDQVDFGVYTGYGSHSYGGSGTVYKYDSSGTLAWTNHIGPIGGVCSFYYVNNAAVDTSSLTPGVVWTEGGCYGGIAKSSRTTGAQVWAVSTNDIGRASVDPSNGQIYAITNAGPQSGYNTVYSATAAGSVTSAGSCEGYTDLNPADGMLYRGGRGCGLTLYQMNTGALGAKIWSMSLSGYIASFDALAVQPWNGGYIYVASGSSSRIVVVDPATQTVVRTFTTTVAPYNIAVNPFGGNVYITNNASNFVYAYSPTGSLVWTSPDLGGPAYSIAAPRDIVGTPGVSANSPPIANAISMSTVENAPVIIPLTGSDAKTCELTFSIVTQPSHGQLSGLTNEACVPGTPNTDSAMVTYSPANLYVGSDSFTFKLNNGTLDSSAATVSIAVNVDTTPPTITPLNNQSAVAGVASSFDFGSFSDPYPAGPWRVIVNWGDNSPLVSFKMTAPGPIFSQSYAYAHIGTYVATVEVGDVFGNASVATFTVTVIAPTTPAITWSNPTPIVFGTPLDGTQLNASASVAGTFSFNPPAGTLLRAGNFRLSATFTPTDTANYTTATASVLISILPATPMIVWPSPADIMYGTPLSGTQLNAATAVGGTFTYTPPPGTVLPVGMGQALSVTFTPVDVDYLAVNANVVINVTPASTPISVNNIPVDAVYGGSFSPKYAYTGDGTTSTTSSTLATCTVTNGVVNFVGVGTCTLTAHAAVGANYAAVDGSAQSVTISSTSVSFAGAQTTVPTSIVNGLVAYYPFDKDSNDYSGFGNNLRLNGGASIVANGEFGGALSLGNAAGSETDYAIASGDNPNLNFGSSDFTIQEWVNFADLSRIETILEKFTDGNGPGWSLSNLPGNALLQFYGTSGSLDASFHFPAVNVWYQIVVVRSGGTVTLYVNTAGGGLNSIGSVALGAIPTSTNPLLVGIRDLAAGQPLGFNGLIDDVAIWDRALTPSEISLLDTNPLSSLQTSFIANICPGGQTTPAPCSQTVTLNYNVNADTTFGATVNVLTQGAPNLDFTLSSTTCTGTITAGNSCTANVSFAPRAPGLRMGAVRLTDSSGNLLVTTMVQGIGQGPAMAFGPGAQSTVPASGLSDPGAVAVDGAGDVFIADARNNRVVEVPAGGGAQTTVGSGLRFPTGVAVDGAGDVFIADYLNNRVVEIPTGGGAQITVGDGLSLPTGVAVDGAGDVFIADGNNRVVKVPAGGGAQTTVGSGLNYPYAVAVDGAGDVFIADTNNNRVVEVPAGGGPQTTVLSGLGNPTGVAVDGAGDVYIADDNNNRVLEVPAGGGAPIMVGGGLGNPIAVVVDGAGDVFIADANNNRVVEVQRSQPPTLSFAATVVFNTSTDSPQSVTVQNIGNQSLAAVPPGFNIGSNSFEPVAGSGTPADCTISFSLAPGANCNLSVSFIPQTTGSIVSAATFTDNALNATAASQSVMLQGTGTAVPPAIASANNTTFTVGTPGSFTVTATGNPAPTLSEVGNLPSGVTFTAATGLLSGTPATGTAGTYIIDFMASNGFRSDQSFLLTVNKATPVITWTDPAPIFFGPPLGGSQLNASASVSGTFSYNPPAGTLLRVGTYVLSATFTPTDTANYTTATASATISVLLATPIISWANPADITYGTPLSGTQLSAATTVGGTFTYTPPPGTVLPAGTGQALSATFTPVDVDYLSVNANVAINVTPAATTTSINAPAVTYNGNGSVMVTVNSAAGTPSGDVSLSMDGGAATAQALAAQAPAALWHFDEGSGTTTADSSGNGNTGTLNAGSSFTGNGKFAGALSLDGTSGVVTIPDAPSLDIPGSLSVEAWVNATTLSAENTILSKQNSGLTNYNFHILGTKLFFAATFNGPVTFVSGSGGCDPGGCFVTGATPVSTGVFHHVAGVYDDSSKTMSVYLDGVLDGSATFATTASLLPNALPVLIGTTATSFFNGLIDEVRIWSRALGASEVLAYAEATSGMQVSNPAAVVAAFTIPSPNAGTHSLNANYAAQGNFATSTATGTLTVNQGVATVTLGNLSQTYNGLPEPVTPTTNPPGLAVNIAYNGSPTAPTSAGSYPVVATVTDANYQGTANGTLVIAQNSPIVTWASPAAITYGTTLGASQLNATAPVSGSFVYSPAPGTVLGQGRQTLSVIFTPTDTTDYSTSTAAVTLVIIKANATVAPLAATKVFGTVDPTLAGVLSGFLATDGVTATYSRTVGETVAGSPYTISATLSPTTALGNYNIIYNTASLTITQATPIVTWATPAAITYGTALSSAQLNASSSLSGSFAYTPTAGTILGGGSQTLSVKFTPTDASDYTTASSTVPLQVNQTQPTVTFTGAPANVNYRSAFTVVATTNASTPGIITASGACTIAGNIVTMTSGTGACNLTANWAADNNYLAASATQSATAAKIAPSVTFTGAPSNASYNSTFTVSATANSTSTAAVTTTGVCTISGNTVTMTSSVGACSLMASWAADNNYLAASATQSTTATKAAPTVSFSGAPASAGYHSTFTVIATTNASTAAIISASGSCSIAGTIVTMTKSVGTCSLTASWTADNNYLAASGAQSTTATKATPVITWTTPAAITYGTPLGGTQLNAKATYNSSPVAGSFAYTPATGAVLGAGSHALSVTFTPTNISDYNSATAAVTLVVNQDVLNINWPKPAAITYETPLSGTQLNAKAVDAGGITPPGIFVYTPAGGTVLNAGSYTLSVTFTPNDTMDFTTASAAVTLQVNKANSITIAGSTPNPSLVGQPVIVSFKVTDLLGNGGPTGSVTVTSGTGESCSRALAPGMGGSCSLTFMTAGSRTLTATYGGDSNFKNSSAKVTQVVVQPKVSLSPATLTFLTQKLNSTSAAKTVTLTNTGTATLNLSTLTIGGDFAIASGTTCVNGGTVAPAANCLINITFTPKMTGPRTGSVTIIDNAAGSPQTVALAGTGN